MQQVRVSLNKVQSPSPSFKVTADPNTLRVFWAPGCSSCIKVKEHLKRLGVEFESINVVATPEAMEELSARGIRGVPVVSRGDKYAYAQSLAVVNEFIGVTEQLPTRETEVIFEKWIALLKIGVCYLESCPAEELRADVLKERERPVGELAYHAFQIVQAFLHCMKTGERDWFERSSGPVSMEEALNKARLVAFARATAEELARYWNDGETKFEDFPAEFEGGLNSSHEFLDRSSWHSAQHIRQIAAVLGRDGIALTPAWSDDFVQGLGVPQNLWQ